MDAHISAVVSWPSSPFTESLVRKALEALDKPPIVTATTPESFTNLLQWSTYDDIDHELTHSHYDTVLSSSYTIRKAVIRKHFLSRCIHSYLTKHSESVLRNAIPRTWDLDISFADELDEMWGDELWDLGQELDDPEKWWILKPGMADRGMGIRLFNSKATLQDIFMEFESDSEEEGADTAVATSQLRHFVIQEYLSNPLLVDPSQIPLNGSAAPSELRGHKFHLRAYCVSSGAFSLYLYRRILALFSAVPYTTPSTEDDPDTNGKSSIDLAPHLTNTSLQTKPGEKGVHLLDELVGCHILSNQAENAGNTTGFTAQDVSSIVNQIVVILAETFKAAIETPIHFQLLPNAFELYGIDFLVTHIPASTFQVKLLEINAEPAIELTGPRLSWILEDLFVATGKVCIQPFFSRGDQAQGLDNSWRVGETRHEMIKCLDEEVRGSGGW